MTYKKVDTLDFPSSFRLPNDTTWSPCEEPGEGPQLEGVVVDEAAGTLYAAQEDIGLWRVQLKHGKFQGQPRAVERTKEFGVPATYDEKTEECVPSGVDPGFGGRIAADTEGLTIYETGKRSGTLLVSSQGDNTFYTYDRQTNRPLKHFAVVDGPRPTDRRTATAPTRSALPCRATRTASSSCRTATTRRSSWAPTARRGSTPTSSSSTRRS